jgi:hypothetical protein
VILIAGLWGGLAPFIGPYFHFTLGPDKAWTWTSGRLWLNVIPGAVAVLAGLILLGAGPRLSGRLGALLAIAAGAWFAVGPTVSEFWHAGGAQGVANGAKGTRIFEMLTFHTGLGVLIATVGGYALPGMLLARRRRVAETEAAAGAAAAAAPGRRRVAEREAAPAAPGAYGTRESAAAPAEAPAERDVAPADAPNRTAA